MKRLLLLPIILALTSCTTPQEWISFRFSQVGADQATIDQAIRVAECESGLNPEARNGQYLGLFQLGEYHYHRPGMDQWWTAQGNAAAAADLWREQGWAPWTCR